MSQITRPVKIPDVVIAHLSENRRITYRDLRKMGYNYYYSKNIINALLKLGIIKRYYNPRDTRYHIFVEV